MLRTFSILLLSLYELTNIAYGGENGYSTPKLVLLDSRLSGNQPNDSLIHQVTFGRGNSLTVLTSQGARLQIWKWAKENDFSSLNAGDINVRSARFLNNEFAVASSPSEIDVVNPKLGTRDTFQTKDIYCWAFSIHTNGLCAWAQSDGSANEIELLNVLTSVKQTIALDNYESVVDLEISPDSRMLAVAVNVNKIQLYQLGGAKQEPRILNLTSPETVSGFPNTMAALYSIHPTFILEHPGMANIVKFSPDSTRLAGANEVAIHLWNLDNPKRPILLLGHKGRVSALAFDKKGTLFSGGEDKTIRQWKVGDTNGTEIASLPDIPVGLSVRDDGRIIATWFPSGEMEIWDVESHSKLLTFHFFPQESGWVAVTPDGLFDSSDGAWRYMGWKMGTNAEALPIERFFRDYYEPRLVSEVLSGESIQPPTNIGNAIPDQPRISLSVLKDSPASWTLTPNEGLVGSPESIRFRVEAHPDTNNDGMVDLQISHNWQVSRKWPGPVLLTNGVCVREFDLEMFPWDNRVAASVYSTNDVRSEEAVWERPMQGYGYMVPPETLYVISVGVSSNLVQNTNFYLRSAARDAESFGKAFSIPENRLEAMRQRLVDWDTRRPISAGMLKGEEAYSKIVVRTLVNEQATRDHVLQVIKDTAASAEPVDDFMFYFSGHGVADGNKYYLVPFDAKLPANIRASEQLPPDFNARDANLISDVDLENALMRLDVSHSAIILDACESGKALKGYRQQALFDPQGLGRLSYEKGIDFLTAAGDGVAFESLKLGHSFLNFALIKEGLIDGNADFQPHDGRIELHEWLSYGAKRAAELAAAEGRIQQPQLAPRIIPERESLILRMAEKEP